MTRGPRYSKRASAILEVLRDNPTKAPTICREVDNRQTALNYRDVNRRDPRSPARRSDSPDDAVLGCVLSLPILVFRRMRGVL